jgi:hypothetical protein
VRSSAVKGAIERRRALGWTIDPLSSVAFSESIDYWAQVLRLFAIMGAIERRWALDRAIDRRIDHSNSKAPNWI